MRPHGSPQELEGRRFRALALLSQGCTPLEVARRVGVDRRSVRRWKAAARCGGSGALLARPATGRAPRLDVRQKQLLVRALSRGAQPAGFPTDLWTCPRVAQWIYRRFAVRYHPDHVGRLLHRLGWSPQKPERRAVESDEVAIRRWLRYQWPAIKKKPRA